VFGGENISHGRDRDANNRTEHKPKTDRSPTRQWIFHKFSSKEKQIEEKEN
jgi:hypothetical protein